MQANDKLAAARMSDKESRKLIFKWHKHFWEGRESLEEDSHSVQPINMRWHNLAEFLMDAYINKGAAQYQETEMMLDVFRQFWRTSV